jgi:hypothetical protein
MWAKPAMSVVLALIVAAGSLVHVGCGTPLTDESTTQSSLVSTTTGMADRHWEGKGVSLDWPAGWRSASVQETMRWPLGRLLDCTALFALDQGDGYPRVELVRLELPADKTLQNAFDEAYATLAAEWGSSMRNVSGWTTVVDGLPALVKSYELPHGEPYYRQQDVWIEFEGSLFVLAGRDGVWGFDENVLPDLDAITQTLQFGAAD